MKSMEKIFENSAITSWANHFLRNPNQVNKPHEADAELIEIPGNPKHYLAVTIDTVAEEITTGLYQDPYTMGWVTVMACLSDLAAVGADPLGLVISVSIEPTRNDAFTNEIARGMEDACRKLDIFILGGDTNITPAISLTACAFGLAPREHAMTRRGCSPGENVFITGGVGTGNALGLVRLTKLPEDFFPEKFYRPKANIKEGQFIREYASCCMDTSDGLLTTLDQLMRLNGSGFTIECNWEKILAPEVLELCNKTKTPPWTMIAGPHGEFELLFTTPDEKTDKILSEPKFKELNLIRLGKVQQSPVISLALPRGEKINVDMAPIRNLLQTVNGDLERYVKEFRALGKNWGLES
jgi:thiamine-monophosphate kinase